MPANATRWFFRHITAHLWSTHFSVWGCCASTESEIEGVVVRMIPFRNSASVAAHAVLKLISQNASDCDSRKLTMSVARL